MTNAHDNDLMMARKIAKGQKDLTKICHCGKSRIRHTAIEANECKRITKTTNIPEEVTKVRRVMPDEIHKMEQMKI